MYLFLVYLFLMSEISFVIFLQCQSAAKFNSIIGQLGNEHAHTHAYCPPAQILDGPQPGVVCGQRGSRSQFRFGGRIWLGTPFGGQREQRPDDPSARVHQAEGGVPEVAGARLPVLLRLLDQRQSGAILLAGGTAAASAAAPAALLSLAHAARWWCPSGGATAAQSPPSAAQAAATATAADGSCLGLRLVLFRWQASAAIFHSSWQCEPPPPGAATAATAAAAATSAPPPATSADPAAATPPGDDQQQCQVCQGTGLF